MKVDKQDLNNLIKRVGLGSGYTDAVAARIGFGTNLNKEILVDLFRDTSERIKRMYSTMNAVGTSVSSMVNIFSSEIEKIEKDIENLKYFADNYYFLSGKDDMYNKSYIDKFDSFITDYRYDSPRLEIPDRDNKGFSAGTNTYVDPGSRSLKVGTNNKVVNLLDNISNIKISTNIDNYITTQTNFENLFNDILSDSWSITAKSPVILNSDLSEYSKYYSGFTNGAKVAVEVEFKNYVFADTIRFRSNYYNGLEILQIVVITEENSLTENVVEHKLLNEFVPVQNINEFFFEKKNIKKVIFIFNQSNYTRNLNKVLNSELNSKALYGFVKNQYDFKNSKFSVLQDMVYYYFLKKTDFRSILKDSGKIDRYYGNSIPAEPDTFGKQITNEIYSINNFDLSESDFNYSSRSFYGLIYSISSSLDLKENFLVNSIHKASTSTGKKVRSIGSLGFISRDNRSRFENPSFQNEDPVSIGNSFKDVIKSMSTLENSDNYEYSFSLRQIDFIVSDNTDTTKACFVSRKMPLEAQVVAVKSKVYAQDNSNISGIDDRDLSIPVSYELSVSNVENPNLEDDWVPILPSNYSSVESEVVFLDMTSYKYQLRFNAIGPSVQMYKDGYSISPNYYSYDQNSNSIKIIDDQILSNDSILTVSYDLDLQNYDPFVLDFQKNGLYKDDVKYFYTSNGSGEPFVGSNSRSTISLSHTPYVNQQYRTNARYSSGVGTTFFGAGYGYSPVKVRLEDGSYASNVTNYTKSPQKVSFTNSSVVQFVHSGKNIVFSQPVTGQFYVEYAFVPNDLRFRLVVRKNISDIDLSAKVDAVLFKFKTVEYDPYFDKLNFLSTINS